MIKLLKCVILLQFLIRLRNVAVIFGTTKINETTDCDHVQMRR